MSFAIHAEGLVKRFGATSTLPGSISPCPPGRSSARSAPWPYRHR